MEVITPEGRVISDDPIDGEIMALATRARRLAGDLDSVKKRLKELGAGLSVDAFTAPDENFEIKEKITVSVWKTIEY